MSDLYFPANAVAALKPVLEAVPGVDYVYKRPLRDTDMTKSVGISALEWEPQDFEMGFNGPTLQRYNLQVQVMIATTNEEEGEADHSVLATSIRTMLQGSVEVRAALGGLYVDNPLDGSKERVIRWKVTGQRFASDQMDRGFVYLSAVQMFVETEIV